MSNFQSELIIKEEAVKLFVFDEVYPLRAAEEQAEKHKLNAFGMMAKLNPLKRPKDDTVNLARKESRYEPFWLIEAVKSVDYSSQITYPVAINNPYAQSVEVDGVVYEISRTKDKAKIDVSAEEFCHRKIEFNRYFDGLNRDTKEEYFKGLLQKYRYSEMESMNVENAIEPLLTQYSAIQNACHSLNAHAINAHKISSDTIQFEKIHLFFVPVFAFEYVWSVGDKMGVIEVNGLTGEISENGQWYKDKFSDLVTRDMLIDLSADIASELIPGSGIAIKVAGRIVNKKQ